MTGRRTLLGLALILLPALAGCGWTPLYADPESVPASADLRAIAVAPIPERIGQRLEMALRESFNPTGIPTQEHYRLRTTLAVSLSDLGLQSQGTAVLGRLDVYATYYLSETKTGKTLLVNTVHSQNSFALNPNQYSTVVGEDDASVRAVAELDREIVTRLTLFMERRHEPKAAAQG